MSSERLKAFSDVVIAIIITIMVLELKAPHGEDFSALAKLWPTLLAYVVSFTYVAIYWNNHRHLFYVVDSIDGAVLWANLVLLFCLSLLPFATAWAAETEFAAAPMVLYGANLLACATAYLVLVRVLLHAQGAGSKLHAAIAGIAASVWKPWLAGAFYIAVAAMWLIPDRRIVRVLPRK